MLPLSIHARLLPGFRFILYALYALPVLAMAAAVVSKPTKILILGDSLTEGLGVDKDDAFPALLDKQLQAWRPGYDVINGGSSGSTSASGVRRLKWYEKAKPDIVLLALGSNDGLRGVKPEETARNVEAAIKYCQERKWQVILTGLRVPPNYGPEYVNAFAKIYPGLAIRYKLPIVEFLLQGVAGEPALNQADGIHPNEKGHKRIADNLAAFLKPLLAQRDSAATAGPESRQNR